MRAAFYNRTGPAEEVLEVGTQPDPMPSAGEVLVRLGRSSDGKEKLGRISKMGDQYIRRLLVTGMTARLSQMKVNPDRVDPWAIGLLERKPTRLASVAMANKTARIIWAVLTRNEYYRSHSA